jgi:hypothetical protein
MAAVRVSRIGENRNNGRVRLTKRSEALGIGHGGVAVLLSGGGIADTVVEWVAAGVFLETQGNAVDLGGSRKALEQEREVAGWARAVTSLVRREETRKTGRSGAVGGNEGAIFVERNIEVL